jgi:N-methylhydantoinase A
VWWEGGGFRATPIHDGTRMGAGAVVDGPAVVEMPETTIVVHPGQRGRVDALGSFVISVDGGAA